MYSVYLRLCDRRLANQLTGVPHRTLPVGRDVVTRRVQMDIFDGFAAVTQDFSPAALLAAGAGGSSGGGGSGGGQAQTAGSGWVGPQAQAAAAASGGRARSGLDGILGALLADTKSD